MGYFGYVKIGQNFCIRKSSKNNPVTVVCGVDNEIIFSDTSLSYIISPKVIKRMISIQLFMYARHGLNLCLLWNLLMNLK